ncbi:MAG: hypothetical protein CSA96_05270 [Bacteroidetes bacterium]|nr:MAG: hypothetical protein CSA96_05270 [Bacteroidota bacterium]
MRTVISIEHLSKRYRLGLVGSGTLKDDLKGWWYRARGKEDPARMIGDENRLDTRHGNYVWALRDINLEIKQGEVLGIIGKNGAGKSTLLKILSRVTGPSEGIVRSKGRIASLLEVGTGMHPELTGRDNVFLNGAILGMNRREIRSKFDEIVDFAGVAKYIDTPVKRYSSGMHVRLGFAVAAFLEPEVLIVDEVLAVGDAEFQRKAIGKMQDVSSGEGRTVLFVSHNMGSIKNLCPNAILLENGKCIFRGSSAETISHYQKTQFRKEQRSNKRVFEENGFKLYASSLVPDKGAEISNGQDITLRFSLRFESEKAVSAILNVYRMSELAFAAGSFHKDPIAGKGDYQIVFRIPPYLLNPGHHSIDFSLVDDTGNMIQYLYARSVLNFSIEDDQQRRGKKYNKRWEGAVSPILDIDIEKTR